MIYTLTPTEIDYCIAAGRLRNTITAAERHDRRPTDDPEGVHVRGVTGEYAVAAALGVLDLWSPIAAHCSRVADDVRTRGKGPGWQVRSTEWPNGGLLIEQRRDNPTDRFILCRLHNSPHVEICGWAHAEEAMHPRYWHDKGYWLLPARKLHTEWPS